MVMGDVSDIKHNEEEGGKKNSRGMDTEEELEQTNTWKQRKTK